MTVERATMVLAGAIASGNARRIAKAQAALAKAQREAMDAAFLRELAAEGADPSRQAEYAYLRRPSGKR